MRSSRLPGKMMFPLADQPVLKLVIQRVKRSKSTGEVVLATSANKENDTLDSLACSLGIDVFRGDENDVFKRFYDCLKHYPDETTIVRVCADNPLICPEVIDFLIDDHNKKKADYSCIVPDKGWPDGVGCEVASRAVFDRLNSCQLTEEEKEHCLLYIWNNKDKFLMNLPEPCISSPFTSDIKIDLDTQQDYEKLCRFLNGYTYEETLIMDLASIIERYNKLFKQVAYEN